MVSKARLDLPEPDRPVITVRVSRGMSTETPLRLCSRAPRTEIWVSMLAFVPDLFGIGLGWFARARWVRRRRKTTFADNMLPAAVPRSVFSPGQPPFMSEAQSSRYRSGRGLYAWSDVDEVARRGRAGCHTAGRSGRRAGGQGQAEAEGAQGRAEKGEEEGGEARRRARAGGRRCAGAGAAACPAGAGAGDGGYRRLSLDRRCRCAGQCLWRVGARLHLPLRLCLCLGVVGGCWAVVAGRVG